MQLRAWRGFVAVAACVVVTLLVYTAHPLGGHVEAQAFQSADAQVLAASIGTLASEIRNLSGRLDEHDALTKAEIISRQQLAEAVDRLAKQEAERGGR